MQRRILHLDMDAFFASVEQARNPSLLGRPVIVGGLPGDSRGVVSAASYEARAFGVRSAMPIAEAFRRCPRGIFLRGDHAHYRAVSRVVRQVVESVSPLVQMASIDEAYVDITGSIKLFGGEEALALHLKREIFSRTHLPCTIGIASNKLVAKVAAESVKPKGYRSIVAGGEAAFFAPLPVAKLPGVGPRLVAQLESMGIFTAGQLATAAFPALAGAMGDSAADSLRRTALGLSESPVVAERVPKQLSRETTFPRDLDDWSEIERVLVGLLEHCAHSLREQQLEAQRVGVKVRFDNFETRSLARTLTTPSSLDAELAHPLRELLQRARSARRVRLVGVQLGQLQFNQHQLPLFDPERVEKWERLMGQVDGLRARHGFNTMRLAAGMRQRMNATPPLGV